ALADREREALRAPFLLARGFRPGAEHAVELARLHPLAERRAHAQGEEAPARVALGPIVLGRLDHALGQDKAVVEPVPDAVEQAIEYARGFEDQSLFEGV